VREALCVHDGVHRLGGPIRANRTLRVVAKKPSVAGKGIAEGGDREGGLIRKGVWS